jgi:hypothetical protein
MPGLHKSEFSPLIERNDFAVDDRVIRHRRQRFHDAGIAAIEIVIVAGAELQFAAGFDGEDAISIELNSVSQSAPSGSF